jgi:hypothetical protein
MRTRARPVKTQNKKKLASLLAAFLACLWPLTVIAQNVDRSAPSEKDVAKSSSRAKAPQRPPAEILRVAHNAFEYGQYEKTVSLLRPLVERGLIKEKTDKVEALRLYGIGLFLTGRKDGARLVFRRAIDLDPTLRLNPRLVPPQVVSAFDRVRKERLHERVRKLKPLKTRYAILNFLPPAGQFQNGQHVKAWSLLGAEVGLLSLNIASIAILRSSKYRHDGSFVVQDVDGKIVEDNRTLAKAMMALNYTSFALLIGTLIYGIVDGYIVMNRQIKKEKARRRFLRKQITVTPSASPSGGGLSLKVDF